MSLCVPDVLPEGEPPRAAGRLRLVLLALFCASPVLGSWLAYTLALPGGGRSYGELLPTRPVVGQDWPRGRWALVSHQAGACNESCRWRGFVMRQVQRGQGEAAERLLRVELGTPTGARDVLQRDARQTALPARDGYYLVDPLGNQVMFYPDHSDPVRVMREVGRILKTNNGLG